MELKGDDGQAMRERIRVTMWRDDHIGDPVGAIFLGVVGDATARLAAYFGDKIRIQKVDLVHNQAHIEVECVRLPDESNRLVATASDLSSKGMPRGARAMFSEALVLDPLNPDAFLGLGQLLMDQKDYPRALAMLKRARETASGDTPLMLQALSHACLKLDQLAGALGYLQRAAELAPNDPAIRRALASLERKRPAALSPTSPPPDALPGNRRA